MIGRALAVLLAFGLVSCGDPEAASPTLRVQVEAAPTLKPPAEPAVTEVALSEPAEAKIAEIRDVLARNSLARLVRLADAEPSFVSNFAGQSHRAHWDLLRRTGFDPLLRLGDLLDGPYGTRQVGDQIWFIWPDLAALPNEALLPQRLSFADRARLKDLIGDTGIARVERGEGYPGIRTAIAEDGRWLYFVHETVSEAEEDEE